MTIGDYRRVYLEHDPCKEGMETFERTHTRFDVFKLLCNPISTDFFLKSVQEGWGPSPNDIYNIFFPFINGKHTVVHHIKDRIVNSQVWCCKDYIATPDTVRNITILGCRGVFKAADWQVVRVFVDANSKIEIECGNRSIVYVDNYGGEVVDKSGLCKIHNHV